MIRKWWIAFAIVMVMVAVAGCGAGECDAICNAKKARELQQVQLDTQADAQLQPMVANAVSVLLISNVATLLLIAAEAIIYGWRKLVFPVATSHEQRIMYLDAKVAISIADAQRQLPPVTNNYGAAIDGEWRNMDEQLQLQPALPVAPSWQQLQASGFVATPERFIVGYAASGPMYIALPGCPAIIVAGRPRKGKTTFLRLCAVQGLQMGGVILFDAHGSVAGARAIPRLAQAATNKDGAMDKLAQQLDGLLDERLSEYANAKRGHRPIFVIADELPRLAAMSEAAIAVIRRAILEGPKVAIYSVVGGQGVSAAMLGGSTARDSAGGRLCYAASQRQAYMVGFDAAAADDVAALDAAGLCYFEGPIPATLLATPNVVEADLYNININLPQLARRTIMPTVQLSVRPEPIEAETEPLRTDDEPYEPMRTDSEEARIIGCLQSGLSISSTVHEVFGVSKGAGRGYMDACAKVNAVIQKLAQGRASVG